jgi:hypothetical protein
MCGWEGACYVIPFPLFLLSLDLYLLEGDGVMERDRGVPRYMVRAEVVDDGEVFLGF